MWLLSKLSSSPAGKYREPRQADVMSSTDFSALIHSQPWRVVELQYDGWYQYAVCEKDGDNVAERRAQIVACEALL
jgi:hypothetical protein